MKGSKMLKNKSKMLKNKCDYSYPKDNYECNRIFTTFVNVLWKDTKENFTYKVAIVEDNYDINGCENDDDLFYTFYKGEEIIGDHGEFIITKFMEI
tara:strand:+ start:711 stop:998 length:288 start_codon:yes stop_codon:yes gene_type:complete